MVEKPFSECIKIFADLSYTDVTDEFCAASNAALGHTALTRQDIVVYRFICPKTKRSIQGSFDLRGKFAVLSAEGNTNLNRAERKWIESLIGRKTSKTKNGFVTF